MTDEELNRRFDSLEARIIDAMREVETKLLSAFHGWSNWSERKGERRGNDD